MSTLLAEKVTEGSHTPGPWQVRAWSSHASTTVGIESTDRPGWFDVVAECSGVGARFTREQEDANARLIAAAPELLAALKAMDTALCDGFDTQSTRMAGRKALIDARAAIAKAEGRS